MSGGCRWGAGRPGTRRVAEDLMRIDLRVLRRLDLLKRRGPFRFAWSVAGEEVGSAVLEVFDERLTVRLHAQVAQGVWQPMTQSVRLEATPCRFGGSRLWAVCPACRGRVLALYWANARFACRGCQSVRYRSQGESARHRSIARFHALDDALSAGKPKWQRWSTFDALAVRHERAGREVLEGLNNLLARLC